MSLTKAQKRATIFYAGIKSSSHSLVGGSDYVATEVRITDTGDVRETNTGQPRVVTG